MATPTRFPDALMHCTVRERSLLPSQWTRNEFGSGVDELFDEEIRIENHQMRLQRQARYFPQRADDGRAHREIGHEMSIHHVDVDPRRPGTLCLGHLFAQTGEIGREDGRRELDRVSRHVASLSLR